MRIKEFLDGREVVFVSSLSRDEVAARINRAASSILNPFAVGRVVGGVAGRRMFLAYRTFLRWNACPVALSAKLNETTDGTAIHGTFGASLTTKSLLVLWYTAVVAVGIYRAAFGGYEEAEILQSLAFLVAGLALPVLHIGFFLGNADKHWEEIASLIVHDAHARPAIGYAASRSSQA